MKPFAQAIDVKGKKGEEKLKTTVDEIKEKLSRHTDVSSLTPKVDYTAPVNRCSTRRSQA